MKCLICENDLIYVHNVMIPNPLSHTKILWAIMVLLCVQDIHIDNIGFDDNVQK